MLQEFNILLPYPMATTQHLLHITHLHINNDTVAEKGSSELYENNISITTAARTVKQFFMKNRIKTPNFMGFT